MGEVCIRVDVHLAVVMVAQQGLHEIGARVVPEVRRHIADFQASQRTDIVGVSLPIDAMRLTKWGFVGLIGSENFLSRFVGIIVHGK